MTFGIIEVSCYCFDPVVGCALEQGACINRYDKKSCIPFLVVLRISVVSWQPCISGRDKLFCNDFKGEASYRRYAFFGIIASQSIVVSIALYTIQFWLKQGLLSTVVDVYSIWFLRRLDLAQMFGNCYPGASETQQSARGDQSHKVLERKRNNI